MDTEQSNLSYSWPVGSRTVTMSVPPPRQGMVTTLAVEWDPDMPKTLSAEELAEYRAGRDRALAQISTVVGGRVGVLEV